MAIDHKFREEIFIDATKDIAGGLLDLVAVEQAHQVFKHPGFEDAIIFGQHTRKRLKLFFNG
jgi:hypothetical protein